MDQCLENGLYISALEPVMKFILSSYVFDIRVTLELVTSLRYSILHVQIPIRRLQVLYSDKNK